MTHHNREAEQTLIGSILRNNDLYDDVANVIRGPEVFSTFAHQQVWGAIQGLRASSTAVNVHTLAEVLESRQVLRDIHVDTLLELSERHTDQKGAKAAARIITKHATVRALLWACTEIKEDAESGMRVEELLEQAERRIFAITQRGYTGTLHKQEAVVKDALALLQKRMDEFRHGRPTGAVAYGLRDLDDVTAGIHAGELVVIGSRPGVGKSIFGCHLADVAGRNGQTSLFCSMEMARVELVLRMLAKAASVNSFLMRKGNIDEHQYLNVEEHAEKWVRHLPIYWDDQPSQTVTRISAQARRLKSKKNLQLVVVDYMQLMEHGNKRLRRYDQIAEISRALKLLARDLAIPVVAMVQLNRESDKKGSKPGLSDIRECGNIEQDADTVILLHMDKDQTEKSAPLLSLLVKKQRNGPICDVNVIHDKQYFALRDAS